MVQDFVRSPMVKKFIDIYTPLNVFTPLGV